MDMSEQVIIEVKDSVGIITLNRPKALNALTLEMIRAISAVLAKWRVDGNIESVFLQGQGDRAFCAGGDIKATYFARINGEAEGAKPEEFAEVYFKEEYDLDLQLHDFPKPVIAFMEGITMGGGFGLAGPCPYRVICEDSIFAMPEVGIGFFPDIGAAYTLGKISGYAGWCLGLTGQSIEAPDILYCGLATHMCERANLDKLKTHLINEITDTGDRSIDEAIQDVLDQYNVPFGMAGSIEAHMPLIQMCFSQPSVTEILDALHESGDEWANEQYELMMSRSPTSLLVTFEHMKRCIGGSFAEVLARDYVLAMSFMQEHDYFEGVRAQVVDKDKNPQWKPKNLHEVTPEMVLAYFTSMD